MYNMYRQIEELCTDRGIKPGRMCADLEISRGIMSDLKAGRTKRLSAENLSKVATYLGVSVDYLLGNKEKPVVQLDDELSVGEKKILELFRAIPEDQQELAIAMIRAATNDL